MMHSRWSYWALVPAVFVMVACGGNGTNVGTDLIHIPATASNVQNGQSDLPAISFQDTLIPLGIITEGTQADASFTFKNTGTSPLVLSDVSTSCGCTLAQQWPRSPIAPGESADIAVRFDSRNRVGANRKEIFVVTNAVPSTTTLVLTAEVIGPSNNEQQN